MVPLNQLSFTTTVRPVARAVFGFPFVVELAADDERKDLEEKGRTLVRLCTRIHSNISARANREYVPFSDLIHRGKRGFSPARIGSDLSCKLPTEAGRGVL